MPHAVSLPEQETTQRAHYNSSVPVGHRTKCRKCGALDTTILCGFPQKVRCGVCGGTVARRRAKKVPKLITYIVSYQLNGDNVSVPVSVRRKRNVVSRHLPFTTHPDLTSAQKAAYTFVDLGEVARKRVAQIMELLDGTRTGNSVTLTYDNYRERGASIQWSMGCETCKGKGLISVRIPVKADEPSRYRLVACVSCSGLGGELTRKMSFGRGVK